MAAFRDIWPHDEYGGDYAAWLKTLSSEEFVRYIVELEKGNYIMAATRRGRKPAPGQGQALLDALTFVSAGARDDDNAEDWHRVVRLDGKQAVTFNGQISAGHPIEEEVTLAPRLDRLEAALKRCGKTLVISETPTGQLSVKGDKLRALVPCLHPDELATVTPDPNIAPVNDKIKEAFKACGLLASEAAEKVAYASLLLEAYTCTGTNGAAVIQFFHGIDLPPHIVLPKLFTQAVAKQTKPLVGFGFSWDESGTIVSSVTFHFEGGAWIKTQCYHDRWPDVAGVLNVNSFPGETLTGLFDGIEAVSEFTEDDWIVFANDKVMSHADEGTGATYPVKGLQGGKKFKGKLIKLVAPFAHTIDLTTFNDRAFFFGGEPATNGPVPGTVRGAIVGQEAEITYRSEPTGTIGGAEIIGDDGIDDDVPIPEDEDQSQGGGGWGQDR